MNSNKKKRQPSIMKLFVMNSDSYMYTLEEAALMNRLGRDVFLKEFLDLGFEVTKRGGKTYIRHEEIKKYQARFARVLNKAV